MAVSKSRNFANKLLSALPDAELDSFAHKLTNIDLPRRTLLEPPKKKIEHIYFLEGGIASIVAAPARDMQVEVGMIGSEGMTGLTVIHMGERTPYSAYMQVGGAGCRASADSVRDL